MSIVAAENAGLVPCELQLGDSWGGVPGKMSVAAPVKKIRKKSDNKPQSQINKCNNEKRRRELENDTINQLEELLGACLSEVRQPDKNGIVQEAAAQIRQVLERRRLGACCSACPPACLPLQHGDVSSTHPAHHSEITALVEALKHYTTSLGWVLLEINCDGEIECVTENIRDIVHWERAELHRQSIYSYVHHGDHHKLLPILQGAAALGWARAERLRAARTRLLIKPDHAEGNGKETERYTEVLLSACLVREAENGPSVLCVIRREEEPAPVPGPPPRPLHQLTFKLDTQGKILLMEGASVAGIEGRHLQELLHPSDTSRVTEHLRGAAGAAGAPHALPGPPARLRLAPHLPYIAAHPHSRMFPHNPITNKGDFVMTTFTVLSEAEITLLESGNNNNAQNPPVGGPLMTSAVVNGNSGPRNGQFPPSPASEPFSFPTSEFDLDYFPHTTWPERSSPSVGFSSFPFSPLTIEEHKLEEKPNISHSGPPTPRTPHTPAASTTPLPPPTAPTPPAPEPDSARLRNLLSKRESPAPTPTPVNEHTAPGTPATPGATNASSGATPPVTPAGNNLILKGLLNQEDEEEAQRGGQGEGPTPRTPPAHHPRTQGNNMLLRLLNEKSDEEDPEQRNNRNNSRSELLSQLLKEGGGGVAVQASEGGTGGGSGGEDLLQLLGLGGQRSALKRKLMQEEQTIKRPHSTDPQQVSSTGSSQSGNTSKLWEKNRMLASLLARRPSAPTAPVPLPNPQLNQRPFPRPPLMQQQQQQIQQQRHPLSSAYHNLNQNQALANLLNNNKGGPGYEMANNNTSSNQNTGLSPLQQMLQGGHRSAPATPTAPASSNDYRLFPRGGGGVAYMGDMSSDTTLSDILDEVMDIVPETYTQDDSELMNYITSAMASQSGQQTNNNQHHHNSYQVEKMAINRIQESLMQCETVVKSPSSPGVPPAYPNTTQAVTSGWAGRYGGAGPASAPSPAQQQRQKAQLAQQQAQKARLLQAQQQQLVVGAAGGAGGQQSPGQGAPVSMDALLNAPTPPNVSLQRTSDAPPYPQPPPPPHYHHHHHHHGSGGGFPGPGPGGQEAPPYKLSLQQQQNPMLNAQLTVLQQSGYSGQRGSPLAPHTPLTPHAGPLSPYPLGPPAPQQHGPPPPRLQRHLSHPSHHPPTMQVGSSGVGGSYYVGGGATGEAGGGGYPPEQVFLPPPPHLHPHHPHQHHHHANNHMSGMTSEYVRQELRAVVGARTSGGGGAGPGGGGGGARPPDLLNAAPPDLESLGLSFEMPPSGGAGGVVVGGGAPPSQQVTPSNQKLWDAHHNTTPTTMEEVRGGDHKSSLLQKLLSE